MFPTTYVSNFIATTHVETVVLLSREKADEGVKQFYRLRCETDGIVFPPKRITDETVCLPVKTEKVKG